MLGDRQDDDLAIVVIDVENDAPNGAAICDFCGTRTVELAMTLYGELIRICLEFGKQPFKGRLKVCICKTPALHVESDDGLETNDERVVVQRRCTPLSVARRLRPWRP